jgi:hypothetical protein
MSVRIAYTGHHNACIAPSAWGVLFLLPTGHIRQECHDKWANTRLGRQTRPVRVGGRHRRRR